jgi:Zn-dependent M16 (insulinase) family peptidase
LDAVLHQLELSQREIAGDSYPYGLQLILGALPSMLHGGDPVALLDLEPVIAKLRERVQDPDYFKSLVKKLLLDNPHRVTLSLRPDTGYDEVRTALVKKQLSDIKRGLSEEEKQKIIDQAEALKQRQNMKDDESILPKVGIADVPLHLQFPKGELAKSSENITCYHQGTNGLVYQQIIIDMPDLDEEQKALLPIYTAVVTALGAGESSYLAMQNKQSALTGGLGAYSSVKGDIDDVQSTKGVLVFSGKALSRNYEALTDLLKETLNDVRFDELERIRELVAQMRARREQGVTSSGHALAMGVASSKMSPGAQLAYRLGGMQGIKALKFLDESLPENSDDDKSDALVKLAGGLEGIHKLVLQQSRQFLLVSESETSEEIANYIHESYKDFSAASDSVFSLPEQRETVKEAWLTSTQVNFCAKAYPTVPVGHEDAPALSVLGGFLRNGYLHRTIREQGGAYGGGAGQDSGSASFRFFSYRDPRLSETLDDFDASLDWLQNEDHDAEELEQAILGVVSQIDKPRSPAGEAKGDYHSLLFGRTQEHREAFRAKVLSVTLDDLQRVAGTYLKPENASVAVISQQSQREALEELGLEIYEL